MTRLLGLWALIAAIPLVALVGILLLIGGVETVQTWSDLPCVYLSLVIMLLFANFISAARRRVDLRQRLRFVTTAVTILWFVASVLVFPGLGSLISVPTLVSVLAGAGALIALAIGIWTLAACLDRFPDVGEPARS